MRHSTEPCGTLCMGMDGHGHGHGHDPLQTRRRARSGGKMNEMGLLSGHKTHPGRYYYLPRSVREAEKTRDAKWDDDVVLCQRNGERGAGDRDIVELFGNTGKSNMDFRFDRARNARRPVPASPLVPKMELGSRAGQGSGEEGWGIDAEVPTNTLRIIISDLISNSTLNPTTLTHEPGTWNVHLSHQHPQFPWPSSFLIRKAAWHLKSEVPVVPEGQDPDRFPAAGLPAG